MIRPFLKLSLDYSSKAGITCSPGAVVKRVSGGHAISRARYTFFCRIFQMPHMSGIDLATAMTLERPGLRVLLMSGFTGGNGH
jgi:hypothetical protein